jgi:DNA-directed RNA polymerase specialized sigma24 family protein
VDGRPVGESSAELVEDLFRKEYAHLVSALTRVLGPANIPLAEDVVHDALVTVCRPRRSVKRSWSILRPSTDGCTGGAAACVS